MRESSPAAALARSNVASPQGSIVTVAVLFGVVFTFTDMSVVYLLTRGGPYNSTHVLASLAYQEGVLGGDVGRGASIAIFLMPVLVLLAVWMLRTSRRAEVT